MNKLVPRLGSTAQIYCIHHVEKRKYDTLIYDSATEKPAECLCCGNVFAYPFRVFEQPLLCAVCDVRRNNGKVV